jgi:hypothetical protein
MDMYLEIYLLQKFPELGDWVNTPLETRIELLESMNLRERAWVQIHLQKNPEGARKLWNQRSCDNPQHHVCPSCGSIPDAIGAGIDLVCSNIRCPQVYDWGDGDRSHPWMGHNHVKPSDDTCGDLRWDSWDN